MKHRLKITFLLNYIKSTTKQKQPTTELKYSNTRITIPIINIDRGNYYVDDIKIDIHIQLIKAV
jgi:hypothetical protein